MLRSNPIECRTRYAIRPRSGEPSPGGSHIPKHAGVFRDLPTLSGTSREDAAPGSDLAEDAIHGS